MAKRSERPGTSRGTPRALSVQLLPIPGLPEIGEGDDLAKLIVEGARGKRFKPRDDDILVVAQKIVSKAEGCAVWLSTVEPSARALRLAAARKKDPRLVEVILRESRRIVRDDPVLIVETHHGFVCANAGVDHSNVPGEDVVTLLPRDPDGSARRLAKAIRRLTGKRIAVVISDTFGRPWRLGLTNVAIGAAGVPVLLDLRGMRDRQGKPLQATILAVADELAAAAGLAMGKSEGIPAVIVRGYRYRYADERANSIIRPAAEDLFRRYGVRVACVATIKHELLSYWCGLQAASNRRRPRL
jgi:coenzyme F420-0:L-glutamate ligase / coenzyme F420-1:gamma-L-glutamate ligase